jgi:hypothetical protein
MKSHLLLAFTNFEDEILLSCFAITHFFYFEMGMCNIPKIHIQESLVLKIIFKCISKSDKSSELYILSNIIHLIPFQLPLFNLYPAPWH